MVLSRLYLATARLHFHDRGLVKPKRLFCSSSKNRASSSKSSGALKEKRTLEVEAVVKKYMAAHSGVFPKAKRVHDEVGGAWYILNDILAELKEKMITPSHGHIASEQSFLSGPTPDDRAKEENPAGPELNELESTSQPLGSHSKPVIDHESNVKMPSQRLLSTNSQIFSDLDSTRKLNNDSDTNSNSNDLSINKRELSSDANLDSYKKNQSLTLEDAAKEGNLISGEFDELEIVDRPLGARLKPVNDKKSDVSRVSDLERTLANNSDINDTNSNDPTFIKNRDLSSDTNLSSYPMSPSLALEGIPASSAQEDLKLSNLFNAEPWEIMEAKVVNREKKLEFYKSSGSKESSSLVVATDELTSGNVNGSDGSQMSKRLQNCLNEISKALPKAVEERRFSGIHIDKITQTKKMKKTGNTLFDMVIQAMHGASEDDGKSGYDNAHLDHLENSPSEDVKPENGRDQNNILLKFLSKSTTETDSEDVKPENGRDKNNILLKFLPKSTTETDIASLFGDCGPIEVHVITSRKENKFNYACVSFKTKMGLQKALKRTNLTLTGTDLVVQTASPLPKNAETISAPNPVEGYVPPILLKNPSRTIMIKGLPNNRAPHDLSVLSSCGRISGFIMDSSDSTCYVEFETEEAKEKALAASSMSISGSLVSFIRIDLPRTTVVRISNIDPKVEEAKIIRVCNSYGRVKKFVRRDIDIVDVHFDHSEWVRIKKIIKSLSCVVINESKWIAQPATVFPPDILQVLLSSPDGQEYVHSVIQNLCRKISEGSLDTSVITGLAEDYYGEKSYS